MSDSVTHSMKDVRQILLEHLAEELEPHCGGDHEGVAAEMLEGIEDELLKAILVAVNRTALDVLRRERERERMSRKEPPTLCERCGAEMFRMHAVWRCPKCGYKTDCCGW